MLSCLRFLIDRIEGLFERGVIFEERELFVFEDRTCLCACSATNEGDHVQHPVCIAESQHDVVYILLSSPMAPAIAHGSPE